MSEINNGIVKIEQNGNEYTVWTHANVVREFVKKQLKILYPGKLIIRELNQIDYVILEENLPIEIQSTTIHGKTNQRHNHNTIVYGQFENNIRRQIEQNIIYGKCILFFDSELLRAMRDASRGISINLDWFRKLMKEERLIVFTVRYDGIVEKKEYKDFDFLSEISQTCPIASETDDKILNKNKINIFNNVIKGYKFTQEEIDKFERDFEHQDEQDDKVNFLIQQSDERAKLYGYILNAIGALPGINQLLSRNEFENRSTFKSVKQLARALGILHFLHGNQFTSLTTIVDKFDILKYFPGYLRNKGVWDKLKGRTLNKRQFDNVVEGKLDVLGGIDKYYPKTIQDTKKSNDVNNDNINNIVEFKIEDRYKIDIKVETKQNTVDNAW